jgi:hypothetical protein
VCLFFFSFFFSFFYDILIYIKSLKDHSLHLHTIFEVLLHNKLFAKLSKCRFAVGEIDYLGHLISYQGVRADPSKLEAMVNWPVPHSIKTLCGFLGLTGYYRKFVRNYGVITSPLTALLKKNAFLWSSTATKAFLELKQAITTPLVLRLLDFFKMLVIECDVCGTSLGAVLMQEGQPIAFLSKALKGQALILSYCGSKIAYLLGHTFTVRTDHQSLKFLLEQRVGSIFQQHWLSKLLGYDFIIEYKK